MVLGFIVALTWALKYTKPPDVKPETILDLSILLLLFGIIGARLLYVLINISDYKDDLLKIVNIRNGGLAWHGGILGAIVCVIIFARFSGISFWKLIDIMSPAVMLGLAIGRWGCFFNGCCYGKPTDFFLGTVFPDIDNIPRHPAQIYESVLDLGIFFILNIINKKKKFEGQTFCYLIVFYSVARFIVEFFREWTSSIPFLAGLNLAQLSSLLMIIVSLFIGYNLSKRKPEKKFVIEDEQDDVPDQLSV